MISSPGCSSSPRSLSEVCLRLSRKFASVHDFLFGLRLVTSLFPHLVALGAALSFWPKFKNIGVVLTRLPECLEMSKAGMKLMVSFSKSWLASKMYR